MLVIDSSAVGALILDNERSPPDAVQQQLAELQLVAPAHWPFEVASLLLNAERHQRIANDQRRFLFNRVRAMQVSLDRESSRAIWERGIVLAQEHRLTIYDAAYLEVAIRLDATLVTLDHDLVRAAPIANVPLMTWPST